MILKEVADYYRTHSNDVYCTILDANKVFDHVEYCKLIRLLITKRLPAVVIRFLLNIYLCQATRISWNGCIYQCIKVLNGVRQGAVLSSVLFCIYFDELIHELESAKFGCHLGLWYIGVLAYADDLVLLAPSANATRKMPFAMTSGNVTLLLSMPTSLNIYYFYPVTNQLVFFCY